MGNNELNGLRAKFEPMGIAPFGFCDDPVK
jgi:hypothetical protein